MEPAKSNALTRTHYKVIPAHETQTQCLEIKLREDKARLGLLSIKNRVCVLPYLFAGNLKGLGCARTEISPIK